MATFTRDWQEALPDDESFADQLDSFIKNLRVDCSDRMKDMVYGLTAGENDGVQGFKQLEFKQQAGAASQPNADEIVLYSIDDGSNCGLYAKEENNVAAQILKYDGTNFGLNGDAIIPDTVDEDAIRLDNNSYLTARNAADNGDINCIKVNASDVPEILVGAVLSANTAPGSDPAIANKKYVDDQIAAATALSAYTANDSEANAMLKSHAYKAATAGSVSAYSEENTGNNLRGYVGATNDPAGAGTKVQDSESSTGTPFVSIFFDVAKDEYFEITTGGTPTIRWRSIGTLSEPIDQD